jgi:hypothetical protein
MNQPGRRNVTNTVVSSCLIDLGDRGSRNRLPKPQTTLKTPYERYKTTPATPHAWRQDNGCQVKDSVNTTKKYIDENSGKMQKDIETFELQCP